MLGVPIGDDNQARCARPPASNATDGCNASSPATALRAHAPSGAGDHALTPAEDAVMTSGEPDGSSASAETTLPRTPSPSKASVVTVRAGPHASVPVSNVWYFTVSELPRYSPTSSPPRFATTYVTWIVPSASIRASPPLRSRGRDTCGSWEASATLNSVGRPAVVARYMCR